MRLVCPNCDAEYEVDASAIPDTGRDVQCSNCGHAWFQMSPRLEEALAAEEALFDPPPALEEPAKTDPVVDAAPDDAPPPPDMAPAPPARALDETVLAVLREEAERETQARRKETPPPIETQEEMGLTAALSQSVAATVAAANVAPEAQVEPLAEPDPVAQRIARMKGIDPAPAKPVSRRDMLPEIDEINTTLRASSERRSGEAAAVSDSLASTEGRSAFRSGFVLAIVAAMVIVALYIMAPKLAQQIPGLEPMLTSYVSAIDAARLWLDGVLQGAIGAMRSSASSG